MCVRSCKRIKHCVVSFSVCRLAWLGRDLLRKSSLLAPNGPWVHMLHFREINIHICWKTRRTAPHSQAHGLDSPDSLHFHACEVFSINFSLSFSQRCSFYSQPALCWQPQLNHYITPQLWWTPYELRREPDSQSEPQPETCVLLCGDRQKRWSEGELKRGIWRAEWAEICPGARPSTMRNICLTSGRPPRQTPHPCQEW